MGAKDAVRKALGVRTGGPSVEWATHAWCNCLEQLRIQRDVAFLGDSLTQLFDWSARFPKASIINLGFYGDTLPGVIKRVEMLPAVAPKRVFLLCGINSLREDTVDRCLTDYATLLDDIQTAVPEAQVFVQSVLPISRAKERTVCRNETIAGFNEQIRAMADERSMTWVDLHPHFLEDGAIAPSLTTDGAHLTDAAYVLWSGLIEPLVND